MTSDDRHLSFDKNAEKPKPNPKPAAGKEQPEFQVMRSAPLEQRPSPLPWIVLGAIVLIAIGVYFLQGGSGDGGDQGNGNGNGVQTNGDKPDPPDVPVEDWVWERLEFLEEQNMEGALQLAEEQYALTPNKELKQRIAAYKRELGLVEGPTLTLPQMISRAQAHLRNKQFEECRALADEVLEEEPNNAEAYYLRGHSRANLGDRNGALGDLQSAIELEHPKEDAIQALIDRLEE